MKLIFNCLIKVSFLVLLIKNIGASSPNIVFVLLLNLMVVIMNIMVLKNIAPNNKEKLLSKLEKGIIRILIKKIIPFVKKIITFLNIKFLNDEIGYLVNVMSNFIFDSKFCNLENKLEAFWFKTLKKRF